MHFNPLACVFFCGPTELSSIGNKGSADTHETCAFCFYPSILSLAPRRQKQRDPWRTICRRNEFAEMAVCWFQYTLYFLSCRLAFAAESPPCPSVHPPNDGSFVQQFFQIQVKEFEMVACLNAWLLLIPCLSLPSLIEWKCSCVSTDCAP